MAPTFNFNRIFSDLSVKKSDFEHVTKYMYGKIHYIFYSRLDLVSIQWQGKYSNIGLLCNIPKLRLSYENRKPNHNPTT